jgi:dihydroneopterin aldolase
MSEDRILLTEMVFHGHHGTLQAEYELDQPFVVSVELRLDLRPAGTSDDLTKTMDYDEEHRMACDIVEGPPVQLTETLAERIVAGTLNEHPEVDAVQVRVAKPHVRLDDTVLDGSAVEIVRRREARPYGILTAVAEPHLRPVRIYKWRGDALTIARGKRKGDTHGGERARGYRLTWRRRQIEDHGGALWITLPNCRPRTRSSTLLRRSRTASNVSRGRVWTTLSLPSAWVGYTRGAG